MRLGATASVQKRGEREEMIRNVSGKEILRETSPPLGVPANLGAALCLRPQALTPSLSTAHQGSESYSLSPPFLVSGWRVPA